MKRWAMRICVLLLLGAIVNVAVAWGLSVAYDVRENSESSVRSEDADFYHIVEIVEGRGAKGFRYIRGGKDHSLPTRKKTTVVELLPNWYPDHSNLSELVPNAQFNLQVWVEAYGWPVLSLYWSREWDSRTRSITVSRGLDLTGYPRNRGGGPPWPRVIPYAPIWPGFAINTVFYAAVLWGLFAVPLALRKRRRIKRGWCPKCAYDLRGRAPTSTVCPECGRTVAAHVL